MVLLVQVILAFLLPLDHHQVHVPLVEGTVLLQNVEVVEQVHQGIMVEHKDHLQNVEAVDQNHQEIKVDMSLMIECQY